MNRDAAPGRRQSNLGRESSLLGRGHLGTKHPRLWQLSGGVNLAERKGPLHSMRGCHQISATLSQILEFYTHDEAKKTRQKPSYLPGSFLARLCQKIVATFPITDPKYHRKRLSRKKPYPNSMDRWFWDLLD